MTCRISPTLPQGGSDEPTAEHTPAKAPIEATAPSGPCTFKPRLTFEVPTMAHTQTWSTYLSQAAGKPVCIVWTHNRRTMLSYRDWGRYIQLRLHIMFATTHPQDLQAIGLYIRGHKTAAAPQLEAFIAAHAPLYHKPRLALPGLIRGQIHDLQALFDALNAAYFHGRCTARIVWGRSSAPRRRRRSIQLGCYVPEDHLIRLHPCLDQAMVPPYFINGVIFHEMLHEVFGLAQAGARRVIHPPEFLAVEQSHPDYARCQTWQKRYLWHLLRYRA